MGAGLGKFNATKPDRASLDEMGQVNYWHPNFLWYGPAGIGTTRGLSGFEDYHQIPFLVARARSRRRRRGADEPYQRRQLFGDLRLGYHARHAYGRQLARPGGDGGSASACA